MVPAIVPHSTCPAAFAYGAVVTSENDNIVKITINNLSVKSMLKFKHHPCL
jgi:hypothetical protein